MRLWSPPSSSALADSLCRLRPAPGAQHTLGQQRSFAARVVAVLAKLLGVGAASVGVALGVWFAASAISSPAASAQVLPPPPGSSSHSSSSSAHRSSPTSSSPSSTAATVRNAKARQAMDDEMYGQPTTKPAAKKPSTNKAPAKASPAKASPSSTPGTVREDKGRQAMDDEMYGHAPTTAPTKTSKPVPSETPGTVQEDRARLAMDNAMDQASAKAAAKQAAAAKQRADDQKRLFAHDPEALQQTQASAQAAKAAKRRAMIDTWLGEHPYAAAVLSAADSTYSNPNSDTGIGLDGSDPRHYQDTWKWEQQESQVCNPGGGQGGSPMFEEYCYRLFASHNRQFTLDDPYTDVEDSVARSNAPKLIKKLFEDAREGRKTLDTEQTDTYETVDRVGEAIVKYQEMSELARAGEAGDL